MKIDESIRHDRQTDDRVAERSRPTREVSDRDGSAASGAPRAPRRDSGDRTESSSGGGGGGKPGQSGRDSSGGKPRRSGRDLSYLVDEDTDEMMTPGEAARRMNPQEKARKERELAEEDHPIVTGTPKTRLGFKDTDAKQGKAKSSGEKKGKSTKGEEKKPAFSRNELSYGDALRVYNEQMSKVNELQPEQIDYVQPEMPGLYKKKQEEKKGRKKRKALGKGLGKLLSKEQKRELAGRQMLDAVRSANELFRETQRRQEQANRDARAEQLRMGIEAGRNLKENLGRSRQEIIDYAREANEGADFLTSRQLNKMGIDQDELDNLGLSHMLPPMFRYGSNVSVDDIEPGNEPYLAYGRVREGSGLDDMVRQWDKEVADRVSVFDDDADASGLVSLEDKFVNGVAPQEIGSKDVRVDRMRKSRIETQKAFLNPLRLFKNAMTVSTLKDEHGNEVREQGFKYVRAGFDKATENAISKVSEAYHGLSITSCLQLVMIRGGIGYDNFVNMKPRMRNDVIVELCQDLVMSEKVNGLPNNIVTGAAYSRGVRDERGNVIFGGTRCFPFGYIPDSLMQEMINAPGSKLSEMTMRQIRKLEWEQFMNNTYPIIYANATQPQLSAYRNAMTALMELDAQNPNYFDIPLDSEKTIMQLYEDQKNVDDDAVSAGTWACAEDIKEMARQADGHYWHRPRRHRSEPGSNIGGHDSSIAFEKTMGNSDLSNTFRGVAGFMASNGAMTIQTMATAPLESGIVAVEDWVANKLDRGLDRLTFGLKNRLSGGDLQQVNMSDYEMTDYLASMVGSKEGKESLDVMGALLHMDGMGWDMVALYNESGYKLTKADLGKFVKELRGMEGRFADFNAVLNNVEHFWRKFQMGEGLLRGADARQWCDRTLKIMSEYAQQGKSVGVFTNKQMEDAISRGGIEQFMREMMFNSQAAQDSFMFTGLNSFDSKNPISLSVERLFNANGITKFALGSVITKYPTYYANKIMQTIPCNTLSYITSSGLQWLGTDMSSGEQNKMAEFMSKSQAGLRSVGDGGYLNNPVWLDGLRRNLIYDAVHFGNKIVMAFVFKQIIAALGGLGLPDDDENKYLMEEYRIGGANGTPTKMAWWMDDIIGCSLPLAYAMYLYENGAVDREGNHVDIDLDTCQNIAFYGITKNSNADALLDAMNMIHDFDANMENLALMCDDPESYAKVIENKGNMPSSIGEYTAATLEHYLIANSIRNSMPAFVNQLIPMNKGFVFRDQSQDAKTAWSVWETGGTPWDPDGRTKKEAMATYETKPVSYREGRIRTDSQDNFVYALLNDFFRIGFNWMGTDETGYMYDEQAVGTKADARALWCYENYYFDPWDLKDEDGNALSNEQLETYEHELADKLISDLRTNYDNPYEAAADGFVIPPVARFNAMNYCWWLYDEEKARYDQWVKANPYLSYQDKKKAWEPVQALYDEYCDPYNNKSVYALWLNQDVIPSDIPKYVKQESTYNSRWVVGEGETARAASPDEVLSGEASKDIYAFGDEPSAFMPFTQPREVDKSFNYETPAYWDVPGWTNRERVSDQLRGQRNEIGMDAGIDLEQLYFGGQPDLSLRIPADGEQRLTIDRRNYDKPVESVLPDILKNPTKDVVESYLGVKCHIPTSDEEEDEKSDTKPSYENDGGYPFNGYGGGYVRYYYGGGGYSSGGGGGGGYSPRIYNTPRQVYSSKPAGMSARAPYKATTTYLRPSFYTKGSREAYRRQDI